MAGFGLEEGYREGIRERAESISSLDKGGIQSMADKVKSVLAEIESGVNRTGIPDIASGIGKISAGVAAAVPTAIYKTAEQIPAGVGKLIGAVPENPKDYGENVGLGLGGRGMDQAAQGFSTLSQAVRQGAMSAFGLKEAPPSITTPITPQSPSVTMPVNSIPSPSEPQRGSTENRRGISPDTFAKMQEVGRQAVAQSALAPKERSTETQVAQVAQRVETPLGKDESGYRSKVLGDIDAEIERIRRDPGSQYGGAGGLRTSAAAQIVELQKAKLGLVGHDVQAATASEGHGVTREGYGVTREGHQQASADRKVATAERTAIERDKLAATKEYHDALAMNTKDKAVQDKFLREEALSLRKTQGEEAAIKTFGQYTNANGETAYHPAIAVFKMIDSGYDTDTLSPQYRSIADRLKAQFKEYAISTKRANPKLTPAQIKGAFYDELRGVK